MSRCLFRQGDVFERMAELPDNSVDLIVTSPPFLALRSYLPAGHPDKHKEIGSEATPAAFLSTLLALTREWRRVLAPHGSICVELGDTYAGSGGAGGDYTNEGGFHEGQERFRQARGPGWPLAKSLCLLPTLYPASLAYGRNLLAPANTIDPWRVRNLVVWHRPNPPVGQLGDKVRPSTSYVTVACTSTKRWFDLDAERTTLKVPEAATLAGARPAKSLNSGNAGYHTDFDKVAMSNPAGAPPLDCWIHDDTTDSDVWTIPTQPYAGSHYATFPIALPRKLINLMCPRQVCVTCGEPRRRIVEAPTELRERHSDFATALRTAREHAGLSQRDVDGLFGFNGMCSHWERRINGPQSQPSYPTPDQWTALRTTLRIEGDEFDGLIDGFRRWNDRAHSPEYREAINRTRREGFYTSGGNDGMARSGVNGRSMRAEYETLGWSDCGHDNWRRGIVLDPFAGSGTTLAAAAEMGRDAIGIDLDERNADLARERIGLFLDQDDIPDTTREAV